MVRGEVLYLKDGSTIKGELVRVDGGVFFFKTSFGAELRVERAKIARIVFSDSLAAMPAPPPTPVPQTSADAGSLMVTFEDVKVSSKISVNRNRDLDGHLHANRIKQALLVDGREMVARVDSTVDKEIREGPETRYRNDMRPETMTTALAPGQYQCEVTLRNVGLDDYADRFVDTVDYSIRLTNIVIRPGEVTLVRIGKARTKLGLGKGRLEVLP